MTRLATAVFDPQGRRAGRFLAEHGTLYRGMPALLALGPPLLARTRVRHHQAEMHKSRLADAYVIYLFDDYQQVKPQINAGLGSLRFVAQ